MGSSEADTAATLRPGCTIVIPAWDDYVGFLPGLLDAVEPLISSLRGRNRFAEVVIVDNASTVPLPPLPDFARVVRSERRLSAGAARNVGLDQATTSAVCFLDADDEADAGGLRALYEELEAAPASVVCQVGARTRHVDGVADSSWPPRSSRALSAFPRLFALRNLFVNQFPIAGSVLRTFVVRELGGYADLSYAEDWCLTTKLAFAGRVDFHPEHHVRGYHPGELFGAPRTRADLLARYRDVHSTVRADEHVPRAARALYSVAGMPWLRLRARFEMRRAGG